MFIYSFVYILFSSGHNRYYIGHTDNLPRRLKDHNDGKVRSTKPWIIIHTEKFPGKSEAYKREIQINHTKAVMLTNQVAFSFNLYVRFNFPKCSDSLTFGYSMEDIKIFLALISF